jgi:hypothetical protein
MKNGKNGLVGGLLTPTSPFFPESLTIPFSSSKL